MRLVQIVCDLCKSTIKADYYSAEVLTSGKQLFSISVTKEEDPSKVTHFCGLGCITQYFSLALEKLQKGD